MTRNQKAIMTSLPDVAVEVMALCQSGDIDVIQVERVIMRDPFVSAQIICLANSPLFAPRMPIVSVRDAIVRIGQQTVSDLILMVVTSSSMFRIPGFEGHVREMTARFPATALAARALSLPTVLPMEESFTVGLMHDIGDLVLLDTCVQGGSIQPEMARDPALLSTILDAIHLHHCKVGEAVCTAWKLPSSTIEAAAYHHDYRLGDGHRFANLADAADVFADILGIGTTEKRKLDATLTVFKDLGLTKDQVQEAMDQFIMVVPAIPPQGQ
jgi:HD-like signal output (HDOD) protein